MIQKKSKNNNNKKEIKKPKKIIIITEINPELNLKLLKQKKKLVNQQKIMNSHINSIILRYKNKTKKLGFKSKLSSEDLSYLIASHFEFKGKILGLKDSSDNFYKLQTFCSSNLLKQNEVYHVIVDSSEIPQQTLQSTQKNQSTKSRNQSIHQYSEPVQNRNLQSEPRYQNSQSHHRTQHSQHQFHLPSQNSLFGLSSMVTIVNNFKVWEDNFQDSQVDRTSLIALVEDKENQQQDYIVNNSLANTFSSEWVNVMNCLVDSYGDRVDYFSCSIKNRDEIQYLKVFPTIIVYKGGQKVMEVSLQNEAKTILRLLERFLNTASGMLGKSGQNFGTLTQSQYPQALLLMEQSVQQTDYDTGDIITIPANIPDQRELLSILDVLAENNQISTLDYFIFKCKILEKFDLFMRNFFESYSEFDQNSFKDYIILLVSQQNAQQKQSNDKNQFDNRNVYNNRPSSSAKPVNNEGKRPPSRQQTSNFGSDQKLGFPQESLINAVIELETSNLLEIPILTQIKRQILQENSEIITIIEGYLSNEYNKQTLSQKLKKAVYQTNQFDRPTSPWPKRDKIIQMFQNIISKQLLTLKEEEEVLRTLIEKNDQQLMGTFSDGRGLDELVKSLKRIASQYFNRQADSSQNKKSRSTNQSADLRGNNNFENVKVNNFLQQSQYQQVYQSQEDQNQQQINRNFNKKHDFNNGIGDQNINSDQIQYQNIDKYSEIKGSDSKKQRIQSANVAHQSPTSSAQFANNQRQLMTASPQGKSNQKQNFLGDINENSPLHTIQHHQQIQQQSGEVKPTNILNLINDNNVLSYTQSDSLNKKLDQITSSQHQSNEDLQIFNSNQGLSQKDQVISSKHKRENSQAMYNRSQQQSNQKPQQAVQGQTIKQQNTDSDDLQKAQNTQQYEGEFDNISEDSVVSPIEFMDEYIDQFNPEDYGMAVYLINQQNDDILQLFQEILQISKTSNLSLSTLPIKIMVQNKYKEVMKKSFNSDELNIIEANKNSVTTSIFAVHQSFRVQCNLDQFISNLKQAIQRDATRKQSFEEPDMDSGLNRQVINTNKGQQERIHADEVIYESNPILPNDDTSTNQQQNIQDNQQALQNQPFSFKQNENTGLRNNQYNNEQSYIPQEIRVVKQPSDQQEVTYQERVSNSAAKKQGLISLHNAQSETEITFKPITNENSDSSIRKRLRTESLQVETNAKFSPKNKRQTSQRQPSPDRTNDSAISNDSQRKGSRSTIKLNNANTLQVPATVSSSTEQSSHFGLINLKKLQQMDVQGVNTGMNVQDNDLNEILSNEINEFFCSYIYNENDRIYDEIVNLSSTGGNPISKKAIEIFSVLYQVNDLEVVELIEEYKRERNLQQTKDKLNRIANYKRRSSYSSIQSVNNKIGKFNLFKKLLTVIENQYKMEKVDFLVQQYLFLHDDVVTLAAFEAYCINSIILFSLISFFNQNWREFVENLVLIEKMSLIKFNLNKTEISKLNSSVLEQLLVIYAYGRYLRNDQKKDLEIIIKQGSQFIQNLINQYDIEDIDQNQLIEGIVNVSKDVSNNLRKEEYIWLQKYSCPSIEERDQLKKSVAKYQNVLKEREIYNLEIFNQLIASANKNLLSALSLYEYNNDTEDLLENLCLIYHFETSNDMKRIIREFSRLQKWDQNQVKFLEQKVDDDEPVLMGAYYHYKKNETDKDEKQELKETFDIYLNQHYSQKH